MNDSKQIDSIPRTVGEALSKNLKNKSSNLSASTLRSDTNKTNQLINWIGHFDIQSMSQSQWDEIISGLIDKYKPRTVNQFLVLLRQSLETAVENELITVNPITSHKTLRTENCLPDPFTKNEIATLVTSDTCESETALITLALSTGLRISELLAISSEVYDRNNKTLLVDQGVVNGLYVYPKTELSQRTIDLTQPAVDAIERLLKLSALKEATTYGFTDVNRKKTCRKRKLLARSTQNGEIYSSVDDFRNKFFINYCNEVKVRYRAPKNFRHTFASQMLSANAPIEWIIAQMGHASYDTLRKHYGKWIQQDKSKAYVQAVEELREMCRPLSSINECDNHKRATFDPEVTAANESTATKRKKPFWFSCKWFKQRNRTA